ncbi:DUF2178 domain-containing protein [Paenibacillus daejeonensis]|uniref:DUF2178 domain-containing protein n=1 Tax=Paenibacillus daejeonensis TaxID=135193 RepID=UPI000371F333|nr:DUF2178 domain-containing protein [Paenibacillus daejeonensis]
MKHLREGRNNRRLFLITGSLVTLCAIYINYEPLMNGEFPLSMLLLAVGCNQLLMAYVAPHIFPKDERSKNISTKSTHVTFFALVGMMLVLLIVNGADASRLDGTQVLHVLTATLLLAIPGSMIFFSKRM